MPLPNDKLLREIFASRCSGVKQQNIHEVIVMIHLMKRGRTVTRVYVRVGGTKILRTPTCPVTALQLEATVNDFAATHPMRTMTRVT